MKGTNHIVTNISTAVIIDTVIRAVSYELSNGIYDNILDFTYWQLSIETVSQVVYTCSIVYTYILNCLLFVFGSLLPDCDQPNSIAGRMLYIPVRHRTWTHTIWFVILFGIMGLCAPCFMWLFYGYCLHLFYDSLSKGGVCWFYPFSKYKIWTSGAQVKKNHKIYLYRTGETSETILTLFIVAISIGASIYAIQLTVNHGELPFHGELLFAVNPA